ncbi:IclR family transcriptional regulator [Actinoallomurus iriomotensis]|uniref:IclR family transcriptional regulator n=1 Tax=Actinoallomurus iriomotensis TaxID=478107 RepID=A0A9W6VQV6_9ACTN|nr:IclR family transcriptional regulator C-terminal domain-containing protein [Actinoallomurus iriomotensis]GLY75862.1 hypothetical protein Airi01_041290 [Actinoallomurus iriomotensis]
MAGNAREAGRTVASKIFSVVDAFAGPQESLRLADIVQRTGLPMPTALRLVRELVEWGGLERFRDGSYRIGQRMWWLGNAAPCPRRLRASVLPTLRDLATRTRADAYLAVLDGTEVRILERVRSSKGSPDDGSLPPHATAAGKVLLARTPALLRSLDFPLPRLTPYTITTPGALDAELRRVRARGIAVEKEEHRHGVVSVAAPLPGADDAAIAVAAPSNASPPRLAAVLREVLRRRSEDGGASPPNGGERRATV